MMLSFPDVLGLNICIHQVRGCPRDRVAPTQVILAPISYLKQSESPKDSSLCNANVWVLFSIHQNRSFMREATVLRLPYTFPGGLPRMSEQTAALAISEGGFYVSIFILRFCYRSDLRMFLKPPSI